MQALRGLFQVAWDFPSVDPPDYLQELHPDLYRQECARVQARFDQAVRLAAVACAEEMQQLVAHLTERLSGADHPYVVQALLAMIDLEKQQGNEARAEAICDRALRIVEAGLPDEDSERRETEEACQ